ncbi:hypothetical protein RND81_07G103000 [Saponaria officinalis]|uniref:Reverse transcriptase n=1 Tax=Saponaria officinalis TaxID=3572 RepID=A0AAW1JNT8_SAPOF
MRVCRGAPRISHLFFADDSILFARANMRECSVIADIISKYERASGQKINYSKSEIVFSKKVGVDARREIKNALDVKEVEKHKKYLGIPTIIGRSKKAIFYGLKERIWKKARVWRLLTKPNTIAACVLKARYFKNSSILDARIGHDPSYTWRSLWSAKSLLLEGLKWRVGNGHDINVWEDAWLPGDNAARIPTPISEVDPSLRVAELIDSNTKAWNLPKLRSILSEDDVQIVLQLPISKRLPNDFGGLHIMVFLRSSPPTGLECAGG